jgi:hypothetical protein
VPSVSLGSKSAISVYDFSGSFLRMRPSIGWARLCEKFELTSASVKPDDAPNAVTVVPDSDWFKPVLDAKNGKYPNHRPSEAN